MVKFKVIKNKHAFKAMKISKRVDAGEEGLEEILLRFIVSLVMEWDFVDVETGEPLAADVESLEEMSLEQSSEMMELFNVKMSAKGIIPKTNAERSPSTSTEESQE